MYISILKAFMHIKSKIRIWTLHANKLIQYFLLHSDSSKVCQSLCAEVPSGNSYLASKKMTCIIASTTMLKV